MSARDQVRLERIRKYAATPGLWMVNRGDVAFLFRVIDHLLRRVAKATEGR